MADSDICTSAQAKSLVELKSQFVSDGEDQVAVVHTDLFACACVRKGEADIEGELMLNAVFFACTPSCVQAVE